VNIRSSRYRREEEEGEEGQKEEWEEGSLNDESSDSCTTPFKLSLKGGGSKRRGFWKNCLISAKISQRPNEALNVLPS